MYAYIKGTLVEILPSSVVIEVNGIGYRLFLPLNAIPHLPVLGNPIHLHTSFVIREFSQALYGFSTSQERDLFEALLDVNGVGPKLALSLIGHMTLQELQHAVSHQDIRSMCKVPGVGKKTAERLIIELRDKISHLLVLHPINLAIQIPTDPKTQMTRDALNALINLGYTHSVAQKAIQKTLKEVPEEGKVDLPSLITLALRNI